MYDQFALQAETEWRVIRDARYMNHNVSVE